MFVLGQEEGSWLHPSLLPLFFTSKVSKCVRALNTPVFHVAVFVCALRSFFFFFSLYISTEEITDVLSPSVERESNTSDERTAPPETELSFHLISHNIRTERLCPPENTINKFKHNLLKL